MAIALHDQDQATEIPEAKNRWVKPEVLKMAAGSAEDGFGALPDGGQPS